MSAALLTRPVETGAPVLYRLQLWGQEADHDLSTLADAASELGSFVLAGADDLRIRSAPVDPEAEPELLAWVGTLLPADRFAAEGAEFLGYDVNGSLWFQDPDRARDEIGRALQANERVLAHEHFRNPDGIVWSEELAWYHPEGLAEGLAS